MIGNLYRNGVAGQINLLGATVNPVRLVWAGGGASIAGVCLTAGGPANAVAPLPAIIAHEPLGPATSPGAHDYLHNCCTADFVIARLSPERLSGVGGLESEGG